MSRIHVYRVYFSPWSLLCLTVTLWGFIYTVIKKSRTPVIFSNELKVSEWKSGNYTFVKFEKTAHESFGHFLALFFHYIEYPHNDENGYTYPPNAILFICCKIHSFSRRVQTHFRVVACKWLSPCIKTKLVPSFIKTRKLLTWRMKKLTILQIKIILILKM